MVILDFMTSLIINMINILVLLVSRNNRTIVCTEANYGNGLKAAGKFKYNFVETPRKFITAKLSIRKLGSSSLLLALTKIRAYGSKALR